MTLQSLSVRSEGVDAQHERSLVSQLHLQINQLATPQCRGPVIPVSFYVFFGGFCGVFFSTHALHLPHQPSPVPSQGP